MTTFKPNHNRDRIVDNLKPKKPKMFRINTHVTETIIADLDELADNQEISRAELIREILGMYISNINEIKNTKEIEV